MNRVEISAWALNIIERVEKGQPFEDSVVELKSEWPKDPAEAARQIAGQANAARGAPILWLIGVHQRKGVVGVLYEELSTWWPQVRALFDEQLAPAMQDVNVPLSGKTVVALLFETDYAPFVVKNPLYNKPGEKTWIKFEVPWRVGTSTWSATRADLLRLLVPRQRLPDVEVLSGELRVQRQETSPEVNWLWNLEMGLYITPSTKELVCIPFHRCAVALEIEGMQLSFDKVRLTPPYTWGPDAVPLSRTIEGTEREVLVHAPGELKLHAGTAMPADERTTMLLITEIVPHRHAAQISVRLQPTHTDLFVPVNASLQFTPEVIDSGAIKWKLR